jgi:hypothetical protein
LFVALATIEISASLMVWREFSPGQPMRKAWGLISLSAGLSLAGTLCVQMLAAQSVLNPLVRMPWWDPSWAASIRQFGLFLGGTCRFATLAVGLAAALKAYRRSGLLARLTTIDWALLAFTGIYMLLEIHDVAMFLRTGWRPKPAMIMGWPTDPLLWLLLAEALLLYRSARQMNGGWIARCWKAFSIGIFVMVLGDVSVWAISRNYLPWPWSALEWYIWLPGASAFALAPVYQLEAIHHARFREG